MLSLILKNKLKNIFIETHCIIIDNFLYYSFNESLKININKDYEFNGNKYQKLSDLYNAIL